jgi:hypothetical protein
VRPGLVLALVALLPVAANAAPWLPRPIAVALCSGDGEFHTILIGGAPPGGHGPHEDDLCPKACHSGTSRRRCHH